MKRSLIILAALAASAVHAQGFAPFQLADTGETCYSWSGDSRTSSGAFSKCSGAPAYVKPAKAALPPAVLPSPVMMPLSAPVTCAPPPKPVVKPKRKPALKC